MSQTLMSWIRLLIAMMAVAAVGCGTVAAGEKTSRVVLTDLCPSVSCSDAECSVRVQVSVGDRTLLSDPLPFSSLSGEIVPIPADSSFGLGKTAGRNFVAWAIGREEKSIAVAMELVPIGSGQGIIVHQVAGFDHPKRAHVVLEITAAELKSHLQVVEGTGPEYISFWPEPAGFALGRSLGASGKEQVEHYHWEGTRGKRSLVPVD